MQRIYTVLGSCAVRRGEITNGSFLGDRILRCNVSFESFIDICHVIYNRDPIINHSFVPKCLNIGFKICIAQRSSDLRHSKI